MKKLIVGLDIDDVLMGLLSPWVAALNKVSGVSRSCDDITDWKIDEFYPQLSRNEVFAVLNNDLFWNTVEPVDGAIDFVNKILEDGHTIKIITSSHYRNLESKMDRFFECFPMLHWRQVNITTEKQGIECNVLIDDAPHNLIGGKYHKIMMNKPYNKSLNAGDYDIERVDNFGDAYNIIQRLASEMCEYYNDRNIRTDKCSHCCNCYDDDAALYCKVEGNGRFKELKFI